MTEIEKLPLAKDLSDEEWAEIVGKTKFGAPIVSRPAPPELPDARGMSDAEFERAMDNINVGRRAQ